MGVVFCPSPTCVIQLKRASGSLRSSSRLNSSNYAMPVHPHAYVRPARPSEAPVIIDILTRAFLNDPAMSYYGVVTALVQDPGNPTASEQKTIRALRVFQGLMLKIPVLTGGNVDVVVIPSDPDSSSSNGNEGKPSKEQIIGASLWLPPGVTLDLSLWTILRAGAYKVAFTWGLTSVKRLAGDYTSAMERRFETEFNARGLDRLDSWHIFAIAVDPPYQGLGYSTVLLNEGFRRASHKPVHLSASSPKNRELYDHFGFDLVETLKVGVGEVDENGVQARDEAAVGIPEFVMIKWNT